MPYEQNEQIDKKQESVYSKRIRAGKRRTYFFDVKATRGNDYFLTITESIKRFDDNGYERHKVFIYKEDFNKFTKALVEAVDYVKTDLMPDFDFDSFNHEYPEGDGTPYVQQTNEAVVVEDTIKIDEIVETAPTTVAEVESPVAKTDVVNQQSNEESTDAVDKW